MSIRSPGANVRADAARRVGDEQRPRAERVQHAHRKARERRVVALVHVEAAGERDDRASAERAGDQRARRGRRRSAAGKPGTSANGDARASSMRAREAAEPGAEHDAERPARRRRCARRIVRRARRRPPARRTARRPSRRGSRAERRDLGAGARGQRASRSACGRKALSKPFSATCASSSKVKSSDSRGVHVLVGERRAAHEPVVGVEHDVEPALEVLAERVRRVRPDGARLHVAREADLERDAAVVARSR